MNEIENNRPGYIPRDYPDINTISQEQDNMQIDEIQNNNEHQGNISKFFTSIMSVDETRISVLLICLVSSVIFGGIMYKVNGTIDEHWVSVIETFAFCVTGINIAGALASGNNFLSKVIGSNNNHNQFRR